MWKAGQLITICGEAYRVKRCEHSYDACKNICKNCAFDDGPDCDLRLYEPKYRSCAHLIPDDCYFIRVSKWKAGQCVTIEGKRYRVTKLNARLYNSCIFCGFRFKGADEYPCTKCIYNNKIPSLIPYKTYLKEIKPKS